MQLLELLEEEVMKLSCSLLCTGASANFSNHSTAAVDQVVRQDARMFATLGP